MVYNVLSAHFFLDKITTGGNYCVYRKLKAELPHVQELLSRSIVVYKLVWYVNNSFIIIDHTKLF